MAKNKRPKYLDKETPELLEMLATILNEDDPDTDKAAKIAAELKDRMAEPEVNNVDEALQAAAEAMTKALGMVKSAYDAEVAMIGDGDGEDEDGDEDEDEPPKKGKKGKKAKAEDDDDEDDGDEDEDGGDDEDAPDYSKMSLKALKTEMRNRGIKVKKGMEKSEMVKALEADDAE